MAVNNSLQLQKLVASFSSFLASSLSSLIQIQAVQSPQLLNEQQHKFDIENLVMELKILQKQKQKKLRGSYIIIIKVYVCCNNVMILLCLYSGCK